MCFLWFIVCFGVLCRRLGTFCVLFGDFRFRVTVLLFLLKQLQVGFGALQFGLSILNLPSGSCAFLLKMSQGVEVSGCGITAITCFHKLGFDRQNLFLAASALDSVDA